MPHLIVKEPGMLQRTPWHQDHPCWAVQGWQIITLWTPLDPVNPVNSKGRNFRTPNPTAEVGVYSDTGLSMARSRSRWLWLAMLPGVLLLTLGLVFLVLWIGFDASNYQEVLLKEVSGWLGRPVRIEGVEVGFLPPRLRLLGVEVGEASGRSGELLFTARYLDADLNLAALFGSEPAVQRFQVMEPTIYLRRDQSGKWNFASVAERPASPQGREPRESSPELPVRDWYLREGTILIQRFGEDPVRLTSLEASLTDLSTSAPFPVEVQFRIGEAGSVRANGRLGPLRRGSKGRLALTARVSVEDVAAEDLEQALGFSALPASVSSLSGSLELVLLEETSRLQGVFDLQVAEGQKLAPLGDWKLNGSARLSHLRCRVAEGADPIRIGSLQTSFQPDRIETTLEGVAVGQEEFHLSAELRNFQAPRLTFSLGGDGVDYAALRSHLNSPAEHSQSGEQHQYPVALRSLTGRGDLSLVELERGKLHLGPIHSEVTLEAGMIRFGPIEMVLHDGRASGSLELKTARSPLSVDLQAELDNVDLNQLLSAHTSYRDKIYGRLSGSLRVQAHASEKGFVRSSRGQAQVEITEGRLTGISLNQELALLSEAIGLRIEREETPIEQMSASVRIAEGWVTTRDLIVQTPDFLLTGTGGFSFEEVIQLDAMAALLPEAVLQTPKQGVLGLLTGALPVDEQSRVLLPFKVRGTFSEPRYQFDAARLAKLKLKGGFLRDLFKRPPG